MVPGSELSRIADNRVLIRASSLGRVGISQHGPMFEFPQGEAFGIPPLLPKNPFRIFEEGKLADKRTGTKPLQELGQGAVIVGHGRHPSPTCLFHLVGNRNFGALQPAC